MKVRSITMTADASRDPITGISGYAVWLSYTDIFNNYKSEKISGYSGITSSATHAEVSAIINGFDLLDNANLKTSKLYINTDSKSAIDMLEGRVKIKIKHSIEILKDCIKEFTKANWCMVSIRHVKAHSGTDEARKKVHDWCDKQARAEMRKALKLYEKD